MGRPIVSHFLILSNSSSIAKLNGFPTKSVQTRHNSKYSNAFRCYCHVSLSQQTSPPTSVTLKKRIVSGVQSTGSIHLGNYLGAIKNWIALQNPYETLFFIVDLHAITLPYDTQELSKATRDTAAIYLACGVDTSKASVFVQSNVHAHVELMWLLSSATPIGWLNRMIQFKEKFHKATDFVPVGEDQKQHLELTRELAERVNYLYGGRKWKKLGGCRSLHLLTILDPKDVIANKIKRGKTDSFSGLEFDNPERPECSNLLSVYQLVSGKTKEDVVKECQGLNWGSFKPLLTDALIEHLHPIQVPKKNVGVDFCAPID